VTVVQEGIHYPMEMPPFILSFILLFLSFLVKNIFRKTTYLYLLKFVFFFFFFFFLITKIYIFRKKCTYLLKLLLNYYSLSRSLKIKKINKLP
jgi:hypothetical protein